MSRSILAVAAIAALCACGRCGATDAPPTPSAETEPVAEPQPAPAEPPFDPAAWCAIIVEINTRHGYMVERRYKATLEPDQMRAIMTDYVERFDEIRNVAPPDLREPMAAIDALSRRALREGEATGWNPPPSLRPSPDENVALGAWLEAQERLCGITFDRP
jgi:hypothetical protein